MSTAWGHRPLLKTPAVKSDAVARNASERKMVLQPGIETTVIPGLPVKFTWCNDKGSTFTLKDSKSQKIFEKDVTRRLELFVTPEELGLKYPENYTWEITGIEKIKGNVIKILSPDQAAIIKKGLNKIEAEKLATGEKTLKKAAYLQFVSDIFPDDMNLDWLSYQLLTDDAEKQDTLDQQAVELLKSNIQYTTCE